MKLNFKKFHIYELIFFIIVLNIPLTLHILKYHKFTYYLALFMSLVFPVLIYIALNIRPFYFILLSFPVLVFAVIYDVQLLEYRSYINISTWATLFDTYFDEAREFTSGLHKTTLLLIGFQILVYIIFLIRTYGTNKAFFLPKIRKIAGLLILLLLIDFSVKGASQRVFPLRGLNQLADYVKTKQQQKKFLALKKQFKYHAKRLPEFTSSQKETIVVVVGESLRRDHLEYYGYLKPTTPIIKQENITVYTDVVSAANQTINTLKRVFTPVEHLDDKAYWQKPSFISIFKEAGFKTYWLTNQPVYGRHESQASFIALESDKFISNPHGQLDEVLIPELAKVLQDTVKKKIIFLHLLGNHASYKRRYPKEFNFFHPEKITDKKERMIHYYDNAVRYNDYVLSEFLKLLKKQAGEKTFIMFSDHGESLYDAYPDYAYHGSEKPSKSEVEIPLIIWFSQDFIQHHSDIVRQVEQNKNLPVISYDFFHAFPALFGIHFDGFKSQNNFFGNTYIPKKQRKIINVNLELLDYDSLK